MKDKGDKMINTIDFDKLNQNRDRIIAASNEDLKAIDNLLNSISLVEAANCSVLSGDFKDFVQECRHYIKNLSKTRRFEENRDFNEQGEFWLYSYVDYGDFQWFPLWEKLIANTKRELNRADIKVFGHLHNLGCDPSEI